MKVRGLLHSAGYRFRLHRRDLPGTPDIVLPKWQAVIDIRGCFWHDHGCALCTRPGQNFGFWDAKLRGNAERDLRNAKRLVETGWRQLIIWECALRGKHKLDERALTELIRHWLSRGDATSQIPARLE
jgi:DNA mismatch endonuclease, patch repair protein